MAGLTGVVAVALLGGAWVATGQPAAELAPPVASPSAVSADVSIARIVLEQPSMAGQTVTTPDLLIRGHLTDGDGPIRISLWSGSDTQMEVVRLDALRAPETGFRPRFAAPFQARFPLPNPRPNGTMFVEVVAFDRDGIPLESLRVPILVGAIAAPSTGVGQSGTGTHGEDGIVGGIVFGTAWLAEGAPWAGRPD
ncbi:MAG TPA: hypothetical protein VD763_05175 [Candidatus Saccharimonadales bacterium]|nr:hypothetical protein [Candidatus Saccharimonadales bacterium]